MTSVLPASMANRNDIQIKGIYRDSIDRFRDETMLTGQNLVSVNNELRKVIEKTAALYKTNAATLSGSTMKITFKLNDGSVCIAKIKIDESLKGREELRAADFQVTDCYVLFDHMREISRCS